MNSVRGESSSEGVVGSCGVGLEGYIVFSTRNGDPESWKPFNAELNSDARERKTASLDAIAPSLILWTSESSKCLPIVPSSGHL